LIVTATETVRGQQPGPENTIAYRRERLGENHWKLIGSVEIERGDSKLYADEAELWTDEDRVEARGNVLLQQGANRISADRAEFNTKTWIGTFYNATGFVTLRPPKQVPRPGATTVPQITGQQDSVYFFGDTVDKLGPKKYKITNGGFTTCVQPTPRWDLHADSVVLNIDHYTLLKQAVLTVKGVPMLYLPILYYPTKKEDRATGFLIPTYGSSTLRGQSLHNAFFWAIDRSEDLTVAHDWFSKTGQGAGAEYRYNFGAGAAGNIRAYLLDQHEASYPQDNGASPTILPAARSYEIHGAASQELPFSLRARGSVDYFSSLATSQTFNMNIYDATRNQRNFGGNLVGAWGTYTLNGTFNHSEYFYSQTNSTISGNWPRFAFSRNERPIGDTPFYFSVNSEYAHILRENKSTTTDASQNNINVDVNQSLTRVDFTPQIRFPFKKWQWFTVNSTFNWRDTFYTRSQDPNVTDPATGQPQILDLSLNRRFFTAQSQIVGPVFTRVWDTPDNEYAEKFKHSIEPFLNLMRTSAIDNYQQIILLDGSDFIVGGTTQYAYGVTNRFYAKRRGSAGQPSLSREIFNVQLTQTYYTSALAAQYDPRYSTSLTGSATPSNFSPVQLAVRAMPATDVNTTVMAEFDSRTHALRTISANGSYAWSGVLQSSLGWTKQVFQAVPGTNVPAFLSQYVNVTSTVHTRDNRVGGIYAFNYDIQNTTMLQQRISAFYNAQCCGIAFEYQAYNLAGVSSSVVPADHRFFLSFTLAGLGNFSPFNGALSGVPR
jgi:lipopolysaccharide assembly outer membrane protein LptD (OstA)